MIKSSGDIQLYTKNYTVPNAKANVLIIHGLAEHCERYAHVAEAFNKIGVSVYTFDLRGHGKSGGPKAFISNIDEYREDVENVYRSIPKNIPFFLLGHSLGGLIALKFLLYRERSDVRGVILSGSALEVGDDVSPLTQKLVGLLGRFTPHLKTVKLNASSISRDPVTVASYQSDPLIHHDGAKAGLALALLNGINEMKPQFVDFDYPVLIMHGGSDLITNQNGSKALYANCKTSDRTIKIWEGAYHEIFNELNKEEVIDYMTEWVKKRT